MNDPFVAIYWVLLCSEHLLKALCAFTHLIPVLILWGKNCYLHFIDENAEASVVLLMVGCLGGHSTDPKLFALNLCLCLCSYLSLMKNFGGRGTSWEIFTVCFPLLVEFVTDHVHVVWNRCNRDEASTYSFSIYWDLTWSPTSSFFYPVFW